MNKIGRVGSRNLYLAPDGRTGLRYDAAKAAFRVVERLRKELDDEVAYSMATGFGDHAKIARLDAAIAAATGR